MKTLRISSATITALCVAFTVSGAAQDRIPDAQREKAADVKAPTLTGCVARGTAADTYTLTSTGMATGSAARTESVAKDEMQPRVVSIAATTVDLAPHVGHQVEVTGTYASAAVPTGPAGTTAPAAPGAPAQPTVTDKDTLPRAFTVQSLKMVAASCATGA